MTTIRLLEENLMANATAMGDRLLQGLRTLQKSYECMGDVRGKGLMVGVELVKDRETKERAVAWRDGLIKGAFQRGLLLLGCGQNCIRFCPALTVTGEEVDVCLTIFEEVLRDVGA